MGLIILPGTHYHFANPKSRSLDLEVDKLTRDFDSDEELRGVMVEQFHIDSAPANWLEAGIPAVPGRIARVMIHYLKQTRKTISNYTLPTIVVPSDMPEYERMGTFRSAWEEDIAVQEQVSDFESALEDAYFDFCKQSMLGLVERTRLGPLLSTSEKCQELSIIANRFENYVFRDYDTAYYTAARAKFRAITPKAEALRKSKLGDLFVMTHEDVQNALSKGGF